MSLCSPGGWFRPSRRRTRATLAVVMVLLAGNGLAWPGPDTLGEVERDVESRYADVIQLDAASLRASLGSKQPPIVLDVREPAEYAVSHLPGALRVDPNADEETVLALVGRGLPDREVVMYCSVGVRSSRLAERSQALLRARGASSVANLRGGIFAWHTAHGPLVNAQGPTEAIHGFDRRWSRLIPRTDAQVVVP